MALREPRLIIEDDVTLTCESAAERGVILCHKSGSAGSGMALGDQAGKADLISAQSGYKVAGMLMHDVVSIDTTKYHRNWHKDETLVGNRCKLMKKGWAVTDKYTGSPTVGAVAYLTANGVLTPTLSTTGGLAQTPKVGLFESIPDADGFVKVSLNLPVV